MAMTPHIGFGILKSKKFSTMDPLLEQNVNKTGTNHERTLGCSLFVCNSRRKKCGENVAGSARFGRDIRARAVS